MEIIAIKQIPIPVGIPVPACVLCIRSAGLRTAASEQQLPVQISHLVVRPGASTGAGGVPVCTEAARWCLALVNSQYYSLLRHAGKTWCATLVALPKIACRLLRNMQ